MGVHPPWTSLGVHRLPISRDDASTLSDLTRVAIAGLPSGANEVTGPSEFSLGPLVTSRTLGFTARA